MTGLLRSCAGGTEQRADSRTSRQRATVLHGCPRPRDDGGGVLRGRAREALAGALSALLFRMRDARVRRLMARARWLLPAARDLEAGAAG